MFGRYLLRNYGLPEAKPKLCGPGQHLASLENAERRFDNVGSLRFPQWSPNLAANDPKGVIFDMDGVLIDSYHAHFVSWQQAAAENGRQYTEEQFAAGFGRTSREVIADQWQGEPLSDERIAAIDQRKEWLFREVISREFPAMEGAVDLIESLVRAGFRVAVGSSGPPENVQLAIDRLGIGRLLSGVVNGRDVKRGKPDPQVFLTAADRMQVSPARCIVVEDAPVGVEAAHRGGMRAIALASTGRTVEQLRAAELVVQSLRELSPARFEEVLEMPPVKTNSGAPAD
jgi:beta-phosphoglucomutase